MFNDVIDIDYAPAEAVGVSVEIGRGSGCIILSAMVSEGYESWYERRSYYGYPLEELGECLEDYLGDLAGNGLIIRDGDGDE